MRIQIPFGALELASKLLGCDISLCGVIGSAFEDLSKAIIDFSKSKCWLSSLHQCPSDDLLARIF
jgi:hypothetical protein